MGTALSSFLCAVFMLAAGGGSEEAESLARAKRALRTEGKWQRVGAIQQLAALGGADAWELVIDALDDPAGEVADTAQLLLGRTPDPDVAARLLGKDGLRSRDEWVRLRVVESLGRMPQVIDAVALARAASDRDSEVRRCALWSIERQAEVGRLGGDGKQVQAAAAKALRRDRDPAVRARALCALAALDVVAAGPLVRAALADRAAAVRGAAVALAATFLKGAELEQAFERAARDGDFAVRARAIDALARVADASAARILAGRMADEEVERLRWRLLDRLRTLSGRKYRFDPRPWQDWARTLASDWRGQSGDPTAAVEPAPASRSVASFGGLPLRSRRLTFLIDLSGSIWTERADGRTPKEIVDVRLREALEALPVDTRFNLIPFTGQPNPWSEKLERATPSNVKKAARFFERRKERGTGNFWDAAMLALEDPDVDTLVVLTDGAPTGGARYQLDLMLPLFVELNATRQVAVDSVLVGAPRGLQRRWAEFSRLTGGHSVVFPLE